MFTRIGIILSPVYVDCTSLGPAHTTPVGDGPHGPSLGPPPEHTVPLGVDLAKPVLLKSAPLPSGSRHVVCLELPPVGVETLEE